METRVTRLEEWAKVSDERLGRIETKLDDVLKGLGKLPNRTEIITYAISGLVVALAVVAVIVTAMGWLETRASRVAPSPTAPIVYQLPAALPAPAPPKK